MKGFADLGDMAEDTRIATIVRPLQALPVGKIVGVCVDDEPGKALRYVQKIREKDASIIVKDQFAGPVAGVITLRLVRQRPESN